MAGLVLTRSRGTLGELFSGRGNGVGAIRLTLALAVVLSHSRPLGFAQHDVGYMLFGRQTNIGTMAVYGFFLLSGLLITRSARRTNIGRYIWHRGLRILPGLWVCLLITALVLAPLLALREHGTLAGFWADPFAPGNPLAYVKVNWFTGVQQYGIQDLLQQSTPWGRKTDSSVFNGPLWSLIYEMGCYVVVGVLAVTGVFKRSRLAVLLLTVALYLYIVRDYASTGALSGPAGGDFETGINLPLIGNLNLHWIIYLGFLFMLGATFELYRDRLPIHDGLGILSAVALVGSLLVGGFFVIGFPAFAYLLIWASVRAPRQVHWIGQKNDYSYGIYIYGFMGQQVMASLGWNRWGFVPFVAMSVAVAFAAAYLSWHLVEKRALRLKGWTPKLPARAWRALTRRDGSTAAPEAVPATAGRPDTDAAAAEPAQAHETHTVPDSAEQPQAAPSPARS